MSIHQRRIHQTTPRKTTLGFLILMAQGHSTTKTSMDAKCEALTESSVSAGTLAETKPLTASLDSRKSRDSTKGKLQTAAMVLTIVSSDSGTSHTHPSSQPMSHLSFSRKIDILQKGQVTSVSVNTLIAGVTSLATDPSYLSSNTAPAVNISLQSQREIQADHSVSNDPSVKTQTDDVEETPSILQSDLIFATALLAIIKGEFISYKKLLVASRGRNRTNECNNKSRPYAFSDSNTLGIIFAASIPKITCSLYLSYNLLRI